MMQSVITFVERLKSAPLMFGIEWIIFLILGVVVAGSVLLAAKELASTVIDRSPLMTQRVGHRSTMIASPWSWHPAKLQDAAALAVLENRGRAGGWPWAERNDDP